jgi:hypothetical protein
VAATSSSAVWQRKGARRRDDGRELVGDGVAATLSSAAWRLKGARRRGDGRELVGMTMVSLVARALAVYHSSMGEPCSGRGLQRRSNWSK